MKHTRATVSTLLSCASAFALSSCGGGGGNGYSVANPAPSVSFSTPTQATSTIRLGETATLTWSAVYATSCTASASSATGGTFTGTQATSGNATVAPTAAGSFTYTLSCTGAGGTGSGTATVTVSPNLLSTLTQFTQIGSTVDPNVPAGGNPYGLAIAPTTSGLITQNDLIVCNFNDNMNVNPTGQGTGTTVVGIHPTAGSTPYEIAHSATLTGCNALSVLPDDSIATADWAANNLALVSSAGAVSTPFSAYTFAQPWGNTYVPAAGSNPAALYVTNYGTGGTSTIDRIELNGDAPTNFTEIASGFCASGSPGAIYAPAGLTYDASIDTLYIVDTSSYSVVAIAGVSQIGTDGVVVNGSCGSSYPTPALQFSGPSASSARVIATGGMFNAPISAALLSNHDLIVTNGDVTAGSTVPPNLAFEISPAIGFVGQPLQLDTSGSPGALFGIATAVDSNNNQIVYFNDDVTSTVYSLTVPPASMTAPAPTPTPPTY